MNPVNPAQDMNMIWMPAPTSIEGFYQAQQQLPSLDELTQQSALMVSFVCCFYRCSSFSFNSCMKISTIQAPFIFFDLI